MILFCIECSKCIETPLPDNKCPDCSCPLVNIVKFVPDKNKKRRKSINKNKSNQIVEIHFDGDFRVEDSMCKWYCKPTCHPSNISKDNVFGCLNPNHYTYMKGDFVPIVECCGNPENCDIAFHKAAITFKEFSVGH